MKLIEDKADRDRLFHRLIRERFSVRAKPFEVAPKVGWPRKHQLWPCVRLGAGVTWLDAHRPKGWNPNPGSRRRALYFLRGHSHEALMAEGQSLVFVYKGVGNEVDEWTGDPEAPFTEIKSTALSSAHMWPIVQKGSADILNPIGETKFHGYFIQSCQNCVATGVTKCRLRIFFLNGDYAGRRKACPQCKKPLGPMRDILKECPACGYKSYAIDMRSYILSFSAKERVHFDKEVFHKRRDQYNAAIQASKLSDLLGAAPSSSCFLCSECDAGKALGCLEYRGS